MTKLMGILNATPDSFYDKGRYSTFDAAIERGIQIYNEGADLIDIGGESTRPGSLAVDEAQELERVIPIISALHAKIPIPISIDTQKPKVAQAAIEAGASFINDVSGFHDPLMQEIAASSGVTICVMHMQGNPRTMQNNPQYPEGIMAHLLDWFEQRVEILLRSGIDQRQIVLDPGIGFGKTVDDNLEIIQNLPRIRALGFPLLVGVSRKSFMGKILNKTAIELLPATIAVNTLLIQSRVDIIRVHDVREHRGVIDLLMNINKSH